MTFVPEDIKQFQKEKAAAIAETEGAAYSNVDYMGAAQLQTVLNAFLAEEHAKNLINNNKYFIEALNQLILKNQTIILPRYVYGTYDFNKAHGLTDHDTPSIGTYDSLTNWADIIGDPISSEQNRPRAKEIEIKGTTSYSGTYLKGPEHCHKADIVIRYVLDKGIIDVYLSPVPSHQRQDNTYVKIGIFEGFFAPNMFRRIRVDNTGDWLITPFK